ncbi:MAG: hypothetical protein SOH80_04920 [Eubacteriales bacterium]|jgi:hypothetical protein
MEDRAKVIFGNTISAADYRAACASKERFVKKFGSDADVTYRAELKENEVIGPVFGVKDVRVTGGNTPGHENPADGDAEKAKPGSPDTEPGNDGFDTEKGIIIGNIRMGFGHYRIAMAMASCAHALGYQPYWMDLNSYPETACTKVISEQNRLYSMGSRISQKSALFNKVVWEPVNYEGFRKLSYNASDQKNAEIMAPVYSGIPKDIPVIGTHVWPAQAALHAGMKYVVDAIPDNWPMALHLAEGAVHTVQTHFAYQGYRVLNGMNGREVLKPMPAGSLLYTGHYVDDELVRNIEQDCEARIRRKKDGRPMRFLLTVGGAGAQQAIFAAVVRALLPAVREKKAVLYVNVGDYRDFWFDLVHSVPGLEEVSEKHFNNWKNTTAFCRHALDGEVEGVHAFWHEDIFEAVYCTNLLMRSADVLVTKPSELSFYPVPKLFIHRVGGHEKWGAIHSAEIGDGTLECDDIPHTLQMADMFMNDRDFLAQMCENIVRNKKAGIYNGGYEVVRTAFRLKNKEDR